MYQIKRLLCAAGCIGLLCLPGFAGLYCPAGGTVFAENAASSGTCGEHVTWSLDDTGTLTIRGTGAMEDYYPGSSAPWIKSSPSRVVIEDGITHIGDYVFCGCTALEEVSIPDSVTSIGIAAFSGCSALQDIVIPASVTDFGSCTFSETPWLNARRKEDPLVIVNQILIDGVCCVDETVIPDGVTQIADCAFWYGTALISVTIPDSVTTIGGSAFYSCSGLKTVSIPESVTRIGGEAFLKTPWLAARQQEDPFVTVNSILIDGTACTGNVRIPEGVTCIAEKAFCNNDNIREVRVPSSCTVI